MGLLPPWVRPSWLEDPAGNEMPDERFLQLTGTAVTSLTDDPANRRTVAQIDTGSGSSPMVMANFAVYQSSDSPPLADLDGLPFSVVISPPTSSFAATAVTYPYLPLGALDFFAISLLQPTVDVTLAEIDICVFNANLTQLLAIRASIALPSNRDNPPAVADYNVINRIGTDLSAYATNTGAQSGIRSDAGGNYAATCSVAVIEP
jgi:hypothetical protein